MRHYPDWIEQYLIFTDNSEAPLVYRKWSAISGIAAALRRKTWITWHDKIFPNMYIVLVGPSGGRKGTALSQLAPMLEELSINLAAEAITREALIRELGKCTDNMVTAEGIYSHSSITIFSPELAVFLGKDNLQLLSDLTDWYDCRNKWTYRTKNQGTDDIPGVWVNLLGATTPSILQNSLPQDAIGGGLTSRIIFVYAPGKDKLVPAPFLTPTDMAVRQALIEDLSTIGELFGQFKFTEGFLSAWIKWYPMHEENPPFSAEKFGGYCERKPTHLLKLSMILNASRTDDMLITEEDFYRGVEILSATEVHMPDVFSGYGRRESADLIPSIMNLIAAKKIVPLRILMSIFITELTKRQLDEVLEALVAMRYCRLYIKNGETVIEYLNTP